MSERKDSGACFCGAVVAAMRGDPFLVCYDHDSDCRRAIGGPLAVWVGYRPDQFRVLTGNPKSFSKTRGVVRTFCADCGTSISYVDQGMPDELYVALGFLDQPERFPPELHAYWCEKLPWTEFADGLPRINRYSRQREATIGTPKQRA